MYTIKGYCYFSTKTYMLNSSPQAQPTNQPHPHFVIRNIWDFFPKKIYFWLQNSKFPAKKIQRFQLLKSQPFLIGINQHTTNGCQLRGWALRRHLCLNPCMGIWLISALLLLWMRAELQRCYLQGVCGTYLHTHIHTHKLKHALFFFLSQFDTLFENTVWCWKQIVGILWMICLFVCCFKTQKSLLRLPFWE